MAEHRQFIPQIFFYSIENFEFLWDNIFREDIEVGLSLCSYREKLKNFVVLMQQNAYQGTLIYESIFKSVRKR